jgi:hypothetical protein
MSVRACHFLANEPDYFVNGGADSGGELGPAAKVFSFDSQHRETLGQTMEDSRQFDSFSEVYAVSGMMRKARRQLLTAGFNPVDRTRQCSRRRGINQDDMFSAVPRLY